MTLVNNIAPLNKLEEERYGQIICYPRFDMEELKRRIREMRRLGVTAICFTGEKTIGNIRVLGKGYVGIVVLGHTMSRRVALKIRRIDADRSGMEHEAEMLRIANTVSVGPNLLGFTGNFLMTEFVDGLLLPIWLGTIKNKEDAGMRAHIVLKEILEQCWRLDNIGLDHGELSRAPKHIIIDAEDKPYLLDFETASNIRKVSNVTSVCHYLFMTREVAESIRRIIGETDQNNLIAASKAYKKSRERESFETILRTCLL